MPFASIPFVERSNKISMRKTIKLKLKSHSLLFFLCLLLMTIVLSPVLFCFPFIFYCSIKQKGHVLTALPLREMANPCRRPTKQINQSHSSRNDKISLLMAAVSKWPVAYRLSFQASGLPYSWYTRFSSSLIRSNPWFGVKGS